MVRCPVCGTPATDDDVFCNGCGQRLPQQIPQQPGMPAIDQPPLPPMPGPPPMTSPGSQAAYIPPAQQQPQVIQPSYQQPVTPSYVQSPPQQSPVIQPAYSQAPVYGQQPFAAEPPKKKSNGCLIAIVVVVILGLCGGIVVAGIAILPELLPSTPPTLTPYDGYNTTGSTGGQTSLDVINNMNVAICYLYVSPTTSDSWGEDWLMSIGTIEPGFSATFYVTVGETVDMQAEDCNGNVLDTQSGIYVPSEGLTYTLNP